jgi:uncharacterized protein (TIGR02246 family)
VRRALLALFLASGSAAVLAQGSTATSAIMAIERRWAESLVKADLEVLGRIYADDLVYVHSGGNTETKAQFLDRVRKGSLKYQKVELVDPKVRVYGQAALVNGAFDVSVQVDGQPMNHRVVYIHAYARQDGEWRMVAHQTTRAAAP